MHLKPALVVCFGAMTLVALGLQPPGVGAGLAAQSSGLTQKEIQRRIFQGERQMIASLSGTTPRLETYLQSLSPQTSAERPIDDAYFLSKVDFNRGYEESGEGRRGYQTFFFGGLKSNRTIRVNNGRRWKLNPDGFLDLLFVDLEDFDADTYELNYLADEPFHGARCLTFSVVPRNPRVRGKFRGKIWVEPSNFKIVRLNGTFEPNSVGLWRRTVGGDIPIYFSFDSVRQEIAPGTWVPQYSYVDEDRTWKQINHNGETDFHYRGHIFIWGYRNIAEAGHSSDLAARLDDDKLLAQPDIVERKLDEIVRRIASSNHLDLTDVQCRVLLTTPIEILHSGHTIILSRGLLNILPDDSALPILLAREMADMIFRPSNGEVRAEKSSKLAPRMSLYAGNWNMALALADRAGYTADMTSTSWLFVQLAQRSKQVPNLVQARFGTSLALRAAPPTDKNVQLGAFATRSLILRGEYTIDAWNTRLQVGHDEDNNAQTANGRLAHLPQSVITRVITVQ